MKKDYLRSLLVGKTISDIEFEEIGDDEFSVCGIVFDDDSSITLSGSSDNAFINSLTYPEGDEVGIYKIEG